MINLPLSQIITQIATTAQITEEAVQEKIKQKLSELSGLISEEGAAHIVANELNVKFDQPPAQALKISGIQAGMRNIDIVGKVRATYEVREFSTATRKGKVGNFLLTDETGTTRIVLWNDQADNLANISTGDTIKITNAYARSNNDRVELHLGHDAKLLINPEGITVDVDINAQSARPEAQTKKVAELSPQDQNVSILATIVQVFDPRYFPVCKECNSRAKEENGSYTCASHGTITPTYNYVMNLFLDDGTDNVRCVLWRAQVESLLGKTHEELIAIKDDSTLFEQYKSDLLGVIVKVRGRVQQNEAFGRLELVAYDIEKDVEPTGETTTPVATPSTEKVAEKTEAIPESTETAEPVAEQQPAPAPIESEEPTLDDLETPEEKKKEAPLQTPSDDEETFTLDDIEDLEDLE